MLHDSTACAPAAPSNVPVTPAAGGAQQCARAGGPLGTLPSRDPSPVRASAQQHQQQLYGYALPAGSAPSSPMIATAATSATMPPPSSPAKRAHPAPLHVHTAAPVLGTMSPPASPYRAAATTLPWPASSLPGSPLATSFTTLPLQPQQQQQHHAPAGVPTTQAVLPSPTLPHPLHMSSPSLRHQLSQSQLLHMHVQQHQHPQPQPQLPQPMHALPTPAASLASASSSMSGTTDPYAYAMYSPQLASFAAAAAAAQPSPPLQQQSRPAPGTPTFYPASLPASPVVALAPILQSPHMAPVAPSPVSAPAPTLMLAAPPRPPAPAAAMTSVAPLTASAHLAQAVQQQPTPPPTAVLPPPPPPARPATAPAATATAAASGNGGRRYHLADFDLMQTLGTGTFGRVHLARLKGTAQYFAMKVLKKTEVVRLKQVEHINSEKAILSRIYHPFIVNLFCTFQDASNLYMLLEYVGGGELFSHLRRAGRFSNDMARFYAAEIVTAIEYLHARDIIYRDLKPENLLLDVRGHIKITDFGFSKVVPDRTWTLCGTPEYLAPEIIQGKGHGRAVDWWSLGILIFEMLCGYPPFYDDSPYGIYEKILAGRIQFPPFVDANARDLIRRLLSADRTKRLGNLKDGAADIKCHRWFKGVDWDAVVGKRVLPPIIPRMAGPGDTANFERYPEPDPEPAATADPFGYLFSTF
ncbi:hypothetical protein GGF32_002974 [Allomyces javanicus]|nr:hypothetical protein GGF32_002974 [Allomyces javanicus]